MEDMKQIYIRIISLLILAGAVALGWFVLAQPEAKPFSLGLDLSGGTHLEYEAQLEGIPAEDHRSSMVALRDVIERRVNLFGVAEPNVQTETARLGQEERVFRLIVELPGVTDVEEAVAMIGETPLLEFKAQNPELSEEEFQTALNQQTQALLLDNIKASNPELADSIVSQQDEAVSEPFISTPLTGAYLDGAQMQLTQPTPGQMAGQPYIVLNFDREGGKLFEEITAANVGKIIAIYLDGAPISTPVVQQKITGGEATITGSFTLDEARQLEGRLNAGALPVPIELVATQSIGPSLGAESVEAGIYAGIIGFIIVAAFLILYYRIPGIIAVFALVVYTVVMLSLFKFIPVTLTAAGIAGFVISLGMAVDANILIFERAKEELAKGATIYDAMRIGFSRAWLSIRDGNISSIMSAAIIFMLSSSLIKGFALTFGIGVIVSMVTAITMTRWFLLSIAGKKSPQWLRTLFTSGLNK